MARKRMISPSFWTDEKMGECNIMERLLFLGLISNADDEGIGRANPKLLKSLIFPYDDLRASDFEKSLVKIASLKLILLYQVDGQNYYFINNFNKHQTINKSTPSDFPKPEQSSGQTTVALHEDYRSTTELLPPNIIEEKRKEVKGKEKNICSEPLQASELKNDEPPVITLTLNDKTEYGIYNADVIEWSALYPAVDVMQALREMKGWLNANPAKRKTKSGILRFINNWLSKNQNSGSIKNQKPKSNNIFANLVMDGECNDN